MSYRVKTVATMTGVPRGTLLAWERRYNLLSLARSSSGYREYSDEDVAFLRALKTLVDGGMKIGEAVDQLRQSSAAQASPPIRANVEGAFNGLRAALKQHLLAYDRQAADRLAPQLASLSFQSAIDQVYVPILKEVGDAWERGEISVAQEHFASAFCREQLMAMFHSLGTGPVGGVSVACTTPPGELHDLALLVVAVRLALAGCRVTWLGPNLPVGDLCGFLARIRPKLLCVSSMLRELDQQVVEYARQIRACAPQETLVVFGGPGVEALQGAGHSRLLFIPSYADFEESVLANVR